jgi:hypothetical protein
MPEAEAYQRYAWGYLGCDLSTAAPSSLVCLSLRHTSAPLTSLAILRLPCLARESVRAVQRKRGERLEARTWDRSRRLVSPKTSISHSRSFSKTSISQATTDAHSDDVRLVSPKTSISNSRSGYRRGSLRRRTDWHGDITQLLKWHESSSNLRTAPWCEGWRAVGCTLTGLVSATDIEV